MYMGIYTWSGGERGKESGGGKGAKKGWGEKERKKGSVKKPI